jgi:hypothetical protein
LQLDNSFFEWDKSEISRLLSGERVVSKDKAEIVAKHLKMNPGDLRGIQKEDGTFFTIEDDRALKREAEKFSNNTLPFLELLEKNNITIMPCSSSNSGKILVDNKVFVVTSEQLSDILKDIEKVSKIAKKYNNNHLLDCFISKDIVNRMKNEFTPCKKPPSN